MSLWGPGYDSNHTTSEHTLDIYHGSGTVASNRPLMLILRPARSLCITRSGGDVTVLLQPETYKMLVIGKRFGGAAFTVSIAPAVRQHAVTIWVQEFDFTAVSVFTGETKLHANILSTATGSTSNLSLELTLIIEKL